MVAVTDTEAIQGLELDRADMVASLRAVAFHVRTQLSSRVASCFPDVRERSKFLDTLIHSGGTCSRLPGKTWSQFKLLIRSLPAGD